MKRVRPLMYLLLERLLDIQSWWPCHQIQHVLSLLRRLRAQKKHQKVLRKWTWTTILSIPERVRSSPSNWRILANILELWSTQQNPPGSKDQMRSQGGYFNVESWTFGWTNRNTGYVHTWIRLWPTNSIFIDYTHSADQKLENYELMRATYVCVVCLAWRKYEDYCSVEKYPPGSAKAEKPTVTSA